MCSPVNFYSLLLAVWLAPASGAYQIPVAIYQLCLYAMAFTACRVEDKTGLLWLGAMLFVMAVPVIVTIYFTGQVLIGLGVLGLERKSVQ